MEAVAMKMLEEGKVLTQQEYDRCRTFPIRSALVLNHFGSWARLVNMLPTAFPAVWKELTTKKVAPKRFTGEDTPSPKDPLEALAKAKSAKKAEESDSNG